MGNGLVRLSDAAAIVEEHPGVPPWAYGAAALVILMALLFVVTRFNPDR